MKHFVRRLAELMGRPVMAWMEVDLSDRVSLFSGPRNSRKFEELLEEVSTAFWLNQPPGTHGHRLSQIPQDRRLYVALRKLRPNPLLFCSLPMNGEVPWSRFLLRVRGNRNWNTTGEAEIEYAMMHEMDFPAVVDDGKRFSSEAIDAVFHHASVPFVKAAIVRDPVTRLLASYLTFCRDEGDWHRCLSSGPVPFNQAVSALEGSILEEMEPPFMRQVDQCEFRTEQYDYIGRYEDYGQDSRTIMQSLGLWDSYGASGWGVLHDAEFGATFRSDATEGKVCDFYTPDLLRRVHALYKDDFEHFGYDIETWHRRCVHVWQTLVASTRGVTFQRRPLPSEVGALLLSGRSACAPTATELLALSGLGDSVLNQDHNLAPMKFFLHNEGSFSFDEVVDCFLNAHNLSFAVDDWDNKMFANDAEHLSELWLLKGFETHPQRTFNRSAADVHVIGVPFFTSYSAGSSSRRLCGSETDHIKRMRRVMDELLRLEEFRQSQGRNFFAFMTHFAITKVFTHPLLEVFNRGNVIVGTADKDYLQWTNYPNVRRMIALPYKSHYVLEANAAAHLSGLDVKYERNISFIFHGDMVRRKEGQHRVVLRHFAKFLDNADIRDVSFLSLPMSDATLTANAYLRSRLCFVPAGDTPSSRRLFDALAAGCVPVSFGTFDRLVHNLPFRRTIDWSQLIIFAGSLRCVENDVENIGRWLQHLNDDAFHGDVISRMSSAGRQVFQSALSYIKPGGMVLALLRELAFEIDQPPEVS
eukprot:TRINITY_DN38223_c0_g3_i1.p1 TRINITY_DN38223_c0_g3~~TRINITY_DN38223_c0_g3_i1.p1  ORF type:complete len:847 (-),score=134.38 TRINITY_DN38223_c0_g3_i1:197-2458(-)